MKFVVAKNKEDVNMLGKMSFYFTLASFIGCFGFFFREHSTKNFGAFLVGLILAVATLAINLYAFINEQYLTAKMPHKRTLVTWAMCMAVVKFAALSIISSILSAEKSFPAYIITLATIDIIFYEAAWLCGLKCRFKHFLLNTGMMSIGYIFAIIVGLFFGGHLSKMLLISYSFVLGFIIGCGYAGFFVVSLLMGTPERGKKLIKKREAEREKKMAEQRELYSYFTANKKSNKAPKTKASRAKIAKRRKEKNKKR